MQRGFALLFFSVAFAATAIAQHGDSDPAFEKIPFQQWLGETDQSSIRWTVTSPRAELSFHQRLLCNIEVSIDGRDLDPRRGHGNLWLLVQITDQNGVRFQNHGAIQLAKLDENVRSAFVRYTWQAFVLPGDYHLAVAILDPSNREHSTRQSQFRVAAPQQEPLTTAWRELSAVEFVGSKEPPEGWYLPGVRGRIQWASSVKSPARINIVLNIVPSAKSNGMAALLPTLKAITETGSPSISLNVELLDLARKKVVFQQKQVRNLDWPRLQDSLGEANTGSIDIHSLSERHTDAQFFVSQVRSTFRGSEPPCVLVVLTRPVAFESGEDLEPISTEGLPACRVLYIRYTLAPPHPVPSPFGRPMGGRNRGGRMGGPSQRDRGPAEIDQLAGTLKPLKPKVFDVEKPEQITKALAEILKSL